MSSRKYESGASKRKTQRNRTENEAKIPKLTNYFQWHKRDIRNEDAIIQNQADEILDTSTDQTDNLNPAIPANGDTFIDTNFKENSPGNSLFLDCLIRFLSSEKLGFVLTTWINILNVSFLCSNETSIYRDDIDGVRNKWRRYIIAWNEWSHPRKTYSIRIFPKQRQRFCSFRTRFRKSKMIS